jgi:CRP-like cAMP-binding protein
VSHAVAKVAGSVLSGVPLLAGVPETALARLAARSEMRHFHAGERLVSELEPGEEALIVLEGRGHVTVGGLSDEPAVEVGEVGPGDCVGEMALFTGELRSATVVAKTAVTALVLPRDRFEQLMARHPSIGAHLARVLSERLRETEKVLIAVLDPSRSDSERREALKRAAEKSARVRRLDVALKIAWRELIAAHRRELPFLMLVSFVATLSSIRAAILLVRHLFPEGASLEDLLRISYVAGLLLLCGAGTASLLWFRPVVRRVLASLFGAGMALLFNSLSVLLTFDLYYQDIFTPDPNLRFSIETLYRRAEGAHVVVIIAALLMQAVYLRRFWRRLYSILRLRLVASRRAAPAAR